MYKNLTLQYTTVPTTTTWMIYPLLEQQGLSGQAEAGIVK